MGCSLIGSSSRFDNEPYKVNTKESSNNFKSLKNIINNYEKKDINPNPSNYIILDKIEYENKLTILKIQYPNCINFEGIKILVFNKPLIDIINQKLIDPHFSDNNKYISPIARFEPTSYGWNTAKTLCEYLIKSSK